MFVVSEEKFEEVTSAPKPFLEYGRDLNTAFDRMAGLFLDEIKTKYNFQPAHITRLKKLLEYTCLGGKCHRGALVISSVEHLCRKAKRAVTSERRDRALAAGWAIEALQACFLVADDIMDGSVTRRGQPCWSLR